jgi:hypothetical protein
MKQIELTSKFVLAALIATVVFSAMTVPTFAQNAPKIPNSYVTSGMIKDGEVKTNDLANDAVTAAKIADGAIQEQDIADGVIPSGNNQPTIQIVDTAGQTLFPGEGGEENANCPSGTVVTGGGFIADGSVKVILNIPEDADTWRVAAFNAETNEFAGILRAWALCMDTSP